MADQQQEGYKPSQIESVNKESEESDTEDNNEVQETDASSQ